MEAKMDNESIHLLDNSLDLFRDEDSILLENPSLLIQNIQEMSVDYIVNYPKKETDFMFDMQEDIKVIQYIYRRMTSYWKKCKILREIYQLMNICMHLLVPDVVRTYFQSEKSLKLLIAIQCLVVIQRPSKTRK